MTAPRRTNPVSGQIGAAITGLGIVYGDLGTSPLYTMQTILEALGGGSPAQSALGVLSLIFWTLIITVSVKYCVFVMRADNQGEGGILALLSLVGLNDWRRGTYFGAAMGLLGAALIYGDGVITPAISVLSAVEGVKVATSALQPLILPLATGILLALFLAQHYGTATIGKAFGPVMLLWFCAIGLLGLAGVVRHPEVLAAVNPIYAVRLLGARGPAALALLGGVFLCATGGEALYADMGHIGRFPIRLAWYGLVLPSLLLNYAGQTGLLLEGAKPAGNPFFLLAPGWAVMPLVVLATLATIIASQAIITGSFSMTRQAMQLGWLPAVQIRQTSDRIYGQIYVPVVNLLMGAATIAITLAFRSSDKLAGAYGTAVSTTMVLTTLLLSRAMIRVWRWPLGGAALLIGVFLAVDLSFFAANLLKIAEGGWIPLGLGLVLFLIMITWRMGVQALRAATAASDETPEQFQADLIARRVPRVPGVGVFLARATDKIPGYVCQYIRNVGALHEQVVLLNVRFEETPRAAEPRGSVERLADGLSRVTLRFGFVETPDLPAALAAADPGYAPSPQAAVFFCTRDLVTPVGRSLLRRRRLLLFAFLHRNALRLVDTFHLPPDRTMEVAREIQLQAGRST